MDEFRSAAISWIREHAKKIEDQRDYSFVHFAAHLFAIASLLEVSQGDLEFEGRQPKSAGSLKGAARLLASLRSDLDAPALYLLLLDVLLTVQDALRPKRDSKALQKPTNLTATLPGRTHALSGKVYHWLRPQPAPTLARERGWRYEEAGEVPKPPQPKPHPMDCLDRLAMFWEKSPHPPRLVPPSSLFNRRLPLVEESGRDFQGGSFRIALCPLGDECYPLFVLTGGGHHFQVRRPEGMEKPRELRNHLTRVVAAAAEEKVHLLMFPELTISPDARGHLVETLRKNDSRWPYGVVAGSFHEWQATSPLPSNEAWLLDHKGAPLLKHQKKKGFRMHRDAVYEEPKFFPDLQPDHFAPGVAYAYENIEDGSTVAVLDTSLGRLALLICFDALAADAESGYENLVQRLRPDLLLVISMSPKTKPFEDFFKAMSKHRIGTLFVNAQCMCKASQLLASGNLALLELKGSPPTRFWWKKGETEAEYEYFKPPDEPTPTGLQVHPLLGLVIDLGVHWTPRPTGKNS